MIDINCPNCGKKLAEETSLGIIIARFRVGRDAKRRVGCWSVGKMYFECYGCDFTGLYLIGGIWEQTRTQDVTFQSVQKFAYCA